VELAPATQYAKSGRIHIAYQVLGDGPFDLVFVPGLVNHLDLMWEDPRATRFFSGLASFARLILFDKRGTGLSDRDVGDAGLEERMDDVRAVMDAVGSQRAALLGYSEGGPMSILFAATFPERVQALILAATFAKFAQSPDYPAGQAADSAQALRTMIEGRWGTGELVEFFAPSLSGSKRAVASIARWERLSGSPSSVQGVMRFIEEIDVRSVLPSLRVPTLIVQRTRDRLIPRAQGKFLADHIPGARLVEQDGDAHILWLGDLEALLGEVQEFLTGARTAADVDRVLATVLFTDIVRSTDKATELGDRRWRQLLDQYDGLVQRQLERFRGRQVKTTGDGTLATFDGPARAVRCASAIEQAVDSLDLHIRAGVHTGEVELRGDDVAGIGVHIAARVQANAGPGEVLVSSTVKDLVVGSGLEFRDRGQHELKGVPGTWRLFALAA
jgi:class 3 adenylate cyclase